MLKHDFFLQALEAGMAKKREWVNSVFAQPVEDPDFWKLNPYPYRVIATETGYDVLLPTADGVIKEEITDSFSGRPLCLWLEPFILQPGELANYTQDTPLTTTYGNVLVNHLTLVTAFGSEIAFQAGRFNIKKVEGEIEQRLTDDPEDDPGGHSPAGIIYVREYLAFCENILALVGYNAIAVQSVTKRALMYHPDARKTREALKEKYKGRLKDPAIIAAIGKELEKLDREWLKGDPTEKFYEVKEGKYFGKIRKRLYYMFGGEAPFSDGTVMEFIERSLQEGIVPEDLPVIINSIRYGSFNRGAQTQLGGEATKTIYRMVGTSRIVEEDCGTTLGVPFSIVTANYKDFANFWQIHNGKSTLLTAEVLQAQIGKTIQIRSPLTCKTEGRNVCEKCMGTALSELHEGLAAAAAQTSGTFLSSFLAAVHGKELKTERLDMEHWLR